jgi:hypothetical protein
VSAKPWVKLGNAKASHYVRCNPLGITRKGHTHEQTLLSYRHHPAFGSSGRAQSLQLTPQSNQNLYLLPNGSGAVFIGQNQTGNITLSGLPQPLRPAPQEPMRRLRQC